MTVVLQPDLLDYDAPIKSSKWQVWLWDKEGHIYIYTRDFNDEHTAGQEIVKIEAALTAGCHLNVNNKMGCVIDKYNYAYAIPMPVK